MKYIQAKNIPVGFNVALAVSRFNQDITDKLLHGAITRLKELSFSDNQIVIAQVPGAIELPITAQRLALTGRYAVIVCLGAVIRGETSHYDYVCEQVSQGCLRVALDHRIPVIFGILTTDTEEQAIERVGGRHGHKGREAIDAAYEMVSVLQQI